MEYILHYRKLNDARTGFVSATKRFSDQEKQYAVDSWKLHKNAVLLDDQGRIIRGRRANLETK